MAWKKLYTDSSSSSQQTKSTNNANEAVKPDLRSYMVFLTRETSCNQLNSSGEVLKEILAYPTLEPKGLLNRKNLKRTFPNIVSGPEAMQLLLDQKLKKARQLADKQRKMRDKEAKKEEKRERIEEEKVQKQLEREEKKKQTKMQTKVQAMREQGILGR